MEAKYIDILNEILPKINKRTEFSVTWFTTDIKKQSMETDITITNYLIDKEFAEYFKDPFIGNLAANWSSKELILLDKGRKLKDCGSIQEYFKMIQNEEQLRNHLNQTVLRNYYINVCLAVSTGVAAVYYLFELFDFFQTHSLNWQHTAYFLSGLGTGLLLNWLTLQIKKYLNRSKNSSSL